MRARLQHAGALAALLLVGLLPAQARRSVIGTVTGPDDEPLADAAVTLVGAPAPGWHELGAIDVVRVTADAAGRFRAELLPTLGYSAWATGPVGRDGGQAASPVVEGVCVGRFANLRARARVAARSVRIDGLEAWQQDGPLRVHAVPSALTPLRLPLAPDAAGVAALPPLPTGTLVIVVLDGAGGLLWEGTLSDGAGADSELTLPPPQRITARVLDGDKPVAGVPIWHQVSSGSVGVPASLLSGMRLRDDWRQVGVTDQDGNAALRVPVDADPMQQAPRRLLFAARMPGRAEAISGWNNASPVVDGVVVEKHGDGLLFHLQAGQALAGRVLGLPGQVVAGMPLLLTGRTRLQIRKNSYSLVSRAFRTEVRPDGTYAFDSLPSALDQPSLMVGLPAAGPGEALVLSPIPWPEIAADQWVAGSGPAHPAVDRAAPGPAGGSGALDLTRTAALTLQLRHDDGAPATGCAVVLMPVVRGNVSSGMPAAQFQLDGSGRATVRLPPGRWFLFACDDRSYRAAVIELADKSVEERLDLQPLAAVTGRVVTAEGRPAPGATLSIRGTRVVGVNLGEEMRLLQRLQSTINFRLIAATEADAEGLFTCRFLDLPGVSFEVVARWQGSSSQPEQMAPGGAEIEFKLK